MGTTFLFLFVAFIGVSALVVRMFGSFHQMFVSFGNKIRKISQRFEGGYYVSEAPIQPMSTYYLKSAPSIRATEKVFAPKRNKFFLLTLILLLLVFCFTLPML